MIFNPKKIHIIAEVANSHEGSFQKALKIIDSVSHTSADSIKFQIFTAEELASPEHKNFQLYRKLQFSPNDWQSLISFAKRQKLKVFVDVFGLKSAKLALKLGVDGFKIHSSDIENFHLLDFLSKTKKPILLSTSGSTINEVENAIRILSRTQKEIVLMHGFQNYPTKLEDLNLHRISQLRKRFEMPVGIMDHVSGDSKLAKIIPLIAIGMGATIVEKHITLDRSLKGIDYFSSLNTEEFSEMVSLIKSIQKSLGEGSFEISRNELKYRKIHRKSPIALRIIKHGEKLTEKKIIFKRTKKITLLTIENILRSAAKKKILKWEVLTKENLTKINPKIVAVIACRVNSNRLFAKPLQNLGKNSILFHIIQQIKQSRSIDDVVLAISENPGNEAFTEFAKNNHLKFIFGDDEDVLSRLIKGAKFSNADIVFRCTSENPFLYWEKIDELASNHIKGKYDYSCFENLPLGSGFELITVPALEISHKKGKRRHRSELCTLYINENKKKFRILSLKPEKKNQRPEIRLTVDTPQDLFVARIIYNSLKKKTKFIKLEDIIKFLDKNPSVSKISSEIKPEFVRYDLN